jgi:hypothetical protein
MRTRNAFLAASLFALCMAGCGGHGSPTEPAGSGPIDSGTLLFVDSGCTCSNSPFAPTDIFVDGRLAGELQVFGKLSIPLPPGPHTWSSRAGDPAPTQVVIEPGRTITVNFFENIDCPDGCGDGSRSALR